MYKVAAYRPRAKVSLGTRLGPFFSPSNILKKISLEQKKNPCGAFFNSKHFVTIATSEHEVLSYPGMVLSDFFFEYW